MHLAMAAGAKEGLFVEIVGPDERRETPKADGKKAERADVPKDVAESYVGEMTFTEANDENGNRRIAEPVASEEGKTGADSVGDPKTSATWHEGTEKAPVGPSYETNTTKVNTPTPGKSTV